MRLDDPARPKIGQWPAYLWQDRAVGPITPLQIQWAEGWVISTNLLVAPTIARYFSVFTHIPQEIFNRWLRDPENLYQSLGWTYQGRLAKRTLTLEDLGL